MADSKKSDDALSTNIQLTDSTVGLAKSLTLFNGITILIGSIIGCGIFISPTGIQEKAGSVGLSLLVWTLAGSFVGIGAYCYSELGTLIHKSGGDYAYIMEAFGPFMAFMRLWTEAFVVRPCTCTIIALTFAVYTLPAVYPNGEPSENVVIATAAVLLAILTVINCVSIRLATLIQDVFTIVKLFALLLIIATGVVLLSSGKPEYRQSFENLFQNTTTDVGSIALAFYPGLYALMGWNYLNFVVEELQNPKRNLPLGVAISCTICTVVFVLTNVAFYTVLSPQEMLSSPAVAVEFANKIFGPVAFVMPIFVACSSIGCANGIIFTSSRLFYAGAREGQMPLFLTLVNKRTRTPIPAVFLMGVLAILYLALSGSVFSLINYSQIVTWLSMVCVMAALFRLRWTMPDADRPIKVNLIFPTVFFLGCCALIIMPIIGSPKDTAIGICIMLTAIPVYLIFVVWKGRPKVVTRISDSATIFVQKLMVGDSKTDDILRYSAVRS